MYKKILKILAVIIPAILIIRWVYGMFVIPDDEWGDWGDLFDEDGCCDFEGQHIPSSMT